MLRARMKLNGVPVHRVWHPHVPCGVVWHKRGEMSLRHIPCFFLCLLHYGARDMITASHYVICLFQHLQCALNAMNFTPIYATYLQNTPALVGLGSGPASLQTKCCLL